VPGWRDEQRGQPRAKHLRVAQILSAENSAAARERFFARRGQHGPTSRQHPSCAAQLGHPAAWQALKDRTGRPGARSPSTTRYLTRDCSGRHPRSAGYVEHWAARGKELFPGGTELLGGEAIPCSLTLGTAHHSHHDITMVGGAPAGDFMWMGELRHRPSARQPACIVGDDHSPFGYFYRCRSRSTRPDGSPGNNTRKVRRLRAGASPGPQARWDGNLGGFPRNK